LSHLILVLSYASSENGVHINPLREHLGRVLGDQFTQLQPQLVFGLSLYGPEGIVVQHTRQAPGCLTPALLQG
jgi:hypothetical protein